MTGLEPFDLLVAPGGRKVPGTVDTWERVMVVCSTPHEAERRRAYDAVGWSRYWPYDDMPRFLRPAWHHEEVQRELPA